MRNEDFLIEILTEELPPKSLPTLAESFFNEITTRLKKMEFQFRSAQFFATPRRLAVLIKKLTEQQPDAVIERRGPALEAAFDKEGCATPACQGFARSCGVTPEQLITITQQENKWVGFQQKTAGKNVREILPTVVEQAINALPISKRMRWGEGSIEFVRPVHAIVMLYGKEIIPAKILGCNSGRLTLGHRFHSKGWISISSPGCYKKILAKKKVLVDFAERKELIRKQAETILSAEWQAHVLIQEDLLDEVTGLVEWPVAICGSFEKNFLTIPQEVLISAMQDHQRYFPVLDQNEKLLPYFVTISNIDSRDPHRVITGNERVLRARLSDAAFFFETDKKQTLLERLPLLKQIVFQTKLGTLYEKTLRVTHLATHIAKKINANLQHTERAAQLAKVDLTTQMVGEFPELQGIMGYYYALQDGEDIPVAKALDEYYRPRFSGDELPDSLVSGALALADRIDTLVGIFGINQAPTGDKDPFGLRRAALGVLRILIEKKLNLDLYELLKFAEREFAEKLENNNIDQVLNFILERIKPWYLDQSISADVIAAVSALHISNPYDLHCRIQAVQFFKKLPDAESLSVANKRVNNILTKNSTELSSKEINPNLFQHDAERKLAEKLAEKQRLISEEEDYTKVLAQLADLREPIDDFFDHVMVMAEDKSQRENRLLMLKQLRELFLHVADIALLQ